MIFRLFISAAAAQAIGLGLGFVTHLSLASMMSVPDYGLFNLIFTISTMISLVAGFGFHAAAQRLIPQQTQAQQTQLIAWSYKLAWVSGAIFAALTFLVMAIFYQEPQEQKILIYGASFCLAVLLSVTRLQVGILKAFHQSTRAICYETVFRELLVLGALWGLWFYGNLIAQAWEILWLYVLIMAVLFAAGFARIKTLAPKAHGQASKDDIRQWLKISLPMMAMMALQTLLHRADLVMLGFLAPLAQVGIYGFAAKIAQGSTVAFIAATSVFAARAAALFHQNDHHALHRLYRHTQIFMILGTGSLTLVLLAIMDPLLSYFDPVYAQGLGAFQILLAGYFVNACLGPSSYLMIMTRHEMLMLYITLAAVIINILLNLVFVPWLGLAGAALSTAITLNLRNLAGLVIFLYDPQISPQTG